MPGSLVALFNPPASHTSVLAPCCTLLCPMGTQGAASGPVQVPVAPHTHDPITVTASDVQTTALVLSH